MMQTPTELPSNQDIGHGAILNRLGLGLHSGSDMKTIDLQRAMNLEPKTPDGAMLFELQVLSGRLKGKRCSLALGRSTQLGSGLENDIVLPDSDIDGRRISLGVDASRLNVNVLAGDVVANGQRWIAGTRHEVPLHTALELGQTVVAVAEPDPVSAGLQTSREVPPEGHPAAGGQIGSGSESGFHLARRPKLRTLMSAGGIAWALSLGGWALGSVVSSPEADTRPKVEVLEAALHEAGFRGLQVQPGRGNALRVTGSVETAAQRASVARMLSQQGLAAQLDVGVDESLVAAVQAVFLAHHVAAAAEADGPGRVSVSTQEADIARLQLIQGRALQDIPRLQSLQVHNAPTSASAPAQVRRLAPGKRISAVVPGDGAYVVTADGSHYFEGAVLPSGQRIAAIRAGDVLLELAGRTSSLPY
jgi:type III secretion protein D